MFSHLIDVPLWGKYTPSERLGEKIWDDEDYERKRQASNLMREIF